MMLHNAVQTAVSKSARRSHRRAHGPALVIIVGILASVTAFASQPAREAPLLSAAVINGVSAYTSTALYDTYRDQLGKPINRTTAQAVIAAVERLYVQDGYSRPVVQVQGDLAASGLLRLQVLEPQITRVAVSGDAGPYAARIDVLTAPLRDQRPVRKDSVQQVLQRLRELPGLSVTMTTQRDDLTAGGYHLLVDADYQGVEGVVQVTNRGTDEIGPHFLLGQVVGNSLFGQAEKFGLVFVSAADRKEFQGGGGFVDLAVGGAGTRVALNSFRSISLPNEEPVDLTDEYIRDKISFKVTHPLRVGTAVTAVVTGTLEMDDLEIERNEAVLRDERLRIVELGGRVSWRTDAHTQYLTTLEVRKGLDDFGSLLYAADLGNDQRRLDFLLTRAQVVRLAKISELWSWRIDALAQHSAYVLPYNERFKIGGERLGRGFEVTEIAGDVGAGAKLELRCEIPRLPEFLGKASVYSFYDYGATWKQDLDDSQSAATVGAGIGLRGASLTGYVEVAKPLTHADVEGDESTRVFAEISYRF
jgi:hemolysin activation/secretion protein